MWSNQWLAKAGWLRARMSRPPNKHINNDIVPKSLTCRMNDIYWNFEPLGGCIFVIQDSKWQYPWSISQISQGPNAAGRPPCFAHEIVHDFLDGLTWNCTNAAERLFWAMLTMLFSQNIHIWHIPTFSLGPPNFSVTTSTWDCSTGPTKKLFVVNLANASWRDTHMFKSKITKSSSQNENQKEDQQQHSNTCSLGTKCRQSERPHQQGCIFWKRALLAFQEYW